MIAEKLINFIEAWSPPGVAWEKDNVGLQVGSTVQEITNIFLCLELTDKVLEEALNKNCNFIFTHHPFIFKPIKKINTNSDSKAKLIEKLIKNNITVYSAHTNLDFTKDGVSFALAKALKLSKNRFLVSSNSNQFKVIVFVPKNNIDSLSNELFNAGAGIIGEYDNCSFLLEGMGTFKGTENSNPVIGKKLSTEKVEEIRLEVLVDSWKLNNVIAALHNAHPYEQPAFDIYPLKNENVNFGFGVIGELKTGMMQNEFLLYVCKALKTKNLRYTKGTGKKIKKVAVCGGSGSDLLNAAISNKADAFITADVKYHTFQEGENNILFIDAGHYETEIIVLNEVKKKLENLIKGIGEPVNVYKHSGSTNPIKYFNNKGVK